MSQKDRQAGRKRGGEEVMLHLYKLTQKDRQAGRQKERRTVGREA